MSALLLYSRPSPSLDLVSIFTTVVPTAGATCKINGHLPNLEDCYGERQEKS